MSGWICGLIGAAIGSWLGFGVAAVLNISGQMSQMEERWESRKTAEDEEAEDGRG